MSAGLGGGSPGSRGAGIASQAGGQGSFDRRSPAAGDPSGAGGQGQAASVWATVGAPASTSTTGTSLRDISADGQGAGSGETSQVREVWGWVLRGGRRRGGTSVGTYPDPDRGLAGAFEAGGNPTFFQLHSSGNRSATTGAGGAGSGDGEAEDPAKSVRVWGFRPLWVAAGVAAGTATALYHHRPFRGQQFVRGGGGDQRFQQFGRSSRGPTGGHRQNGVPGKRLASGSHRPFELGGAHRAEVRRWHFPGRGLSPPSGIIDDAQTAGPVGLYGPILL